MTLFWHHPRLIAVLLGHQSHIQSIFHGLQSECMNNTTKQPLRHSNLDASRFIYHPSYTFVLKICPNHAEIWFKLGCLYGASESSVTLFTNCNKGLNNLTRKSSDKNCMHVTGMAICERSVPRMMFGDEIHFHALCAHTSTTQTTDICR